MKEKRFVVTVCYYEYANDVETAYKKAIKRTSKMNRRLDCRAQVYAISEQPFGTLKEIPGDMEELETKHGKGFV